jgi:hypothetical protein
MATSNLHRELDPARRGPKTDGYAVESAILPQLDHRQSCTLEERARILPRFILNQVFPGVARPVGKETSSSGPLADLTISSRQWCTTSTTRVPRAGNRQFR